MNRGIETRIIIPDSFCDKDIHGLRYISRIIVSWTDISVMSISTWAQDLPLNLGKRRILQSQLYHRLSHEMASSGKLPIRTRHDSSHERRAQDISFGYFSKSIRENDEEFIKYLKFVHFLVCGEDSSFRNVRAVSGSQSWLSDYGYIEFIQESDIIKNIKRIFYLVKIGFESDDMGVKLAWCITLYASILSIHPFKDGNGRVSRVVLNCCLCYIFGKSMYFPESELSHISKYGFLLCKREAQLFGRWKPLIDLFCRSVEQLNSLADMGYIVECYFNEKYKCRISAELLSCNFPYICVESD